MIASIACFLQLMGLFWLPITAVLILILLFTGLQSAHDLLQRSLDTE